MNNITPSWGQMYSFKAMSYVVLFAVYTFSSKIIVSKTNFEGSLKNLNLNLRKLNISNLENQLEA